MACLVGTNRHGLGSQSKWSDSVSFVSHGAWCFGTLMESSHLAFLYCIYLSIYQSIYLGLGTQLLASRNPSRWTYLGRRSTHDGRDGHFSARRIGPGPRWYARGCRPDLANWTNHHHADGGNSGSGRTRRCVGSSGTDRGWRKLMFRVPFQKLVRPLQLQVHFYSDGLGGAEGLFVDDIRVLYSSGDGGDPFDRSR